MKMGTMLRIRSDGKDKWVIRRRGYALSKVASPQENMRYIPQGKTHRCHRNGIFGEIRKG